MILGTIGVVHTPNLRREGLFFSSCSEPGKVDCIGSGIIRVAARALASELEDDVLQRVYAIGAAQ